MKRDPENDTEPGPLDWAAAVAPSPLGAADTAPVPPRPEAATSEQDAAAQLLRALALQPRGPTPIAEQRATSDGGAFVGYTGARHAPSPRVAPSSGGPERVQVALLALAGASGGPAEAPVSTDVLSRDGDTTYVLGRQRGRRRLARRAAIAAFASALAVAATAVLWSFARVTPRSGGAAGPASELSASPVAPPSGAAPPGRPVALSTAVAPPAAPSRPVSIAPPSDSAAETAPGAEASSHAGVPARLAPPPGHAPPASPRPSAPARPAPPVVSSAPEVGFLPDHP
ncbi:MAG: hypothetical protein JOZ69_06800 [Myxococcales bacterium]|nr:hypothetical protein [Myxococcales bacterium]